MKHSFLLLFIIISCTYFATAQDSISSKPKHNISVTPFHAPFGILEAVPSYHFTIAYVRYFSNHGNWFWTIPLTIGSAKTFMISDYYRKGFNVFLSPGIGYVPNRFLKNQVYQVSGHVLLGYAGYDVDTWGKQIINKNAYTGFLINNHLTIPITKRSAIHYFIGLGAKFERTNKTTTYYPSEPLTKSEEFLVKPIFNLGLGMNFRLNKP